MPSERMPATTFFWISHSEWSPQYTPTPRAPVTVFFDTSPIDISLIVIPRRRVPWTWFPITMTIDECVTMPSRPPETSQSSTALMPQSIE